MYKREKEKREINAEKEKGKGVRIKREGKIVKCSKTAFPSLFPLSPLKTLFPQNIQT